MCRANRLSMRTIDLLHLKTAFSLPSANVRTSQCSKIRRLSPVLPAFSSFPCGLNLSPNQSALWRTQYPTVEELSETSRDHTFILYGTLSRMFVTRCGLVPSSSVTFPALGPHVLFVKETDVRIKTDLLGQLPPQSFTLDGPRRPEAENQASPYFQ